MPRLSLANLLAIILLLPVIIGCWNSAPPGAGPTPIEQARRLKCQNDLRTIVMGIQGYVADRGAGRNWPRTMQALLDEKLVTPEVLRCPDDTTAGPAPSYQAVFDLTDKQIVDGKLSGNAIVVWDTAPRHGDGRCVGHADTSTEWLSEKDFQQELQKLKAKLNE